MQYALNIDIPDSGILFDDMAFENGATVPAGRFIQPRIEAEIAFVMKAPPGGGDITSRWLKAPNRRARWSGPLPIRRMGAAGRRPPRIQCPDRKKPGNA